jgi:RNA polymerase sigma-70 factor (ECF subfamily)
VSPLSTQDVRCARFEALMAEVYEPLQRYAGRRTDAETASDVVAEVLLVLWRRLDEVPADSVVPWSYGVARRVLANSRRGDARRLRLVERMAQQRAVPPEVVPSATDPRDVALDEALHRLDASDREVVGLWAWEGLEPREIAVVLDTTPNAASIRLHRAKARLRSLVDAALDREESRKDPIASGHLRLEGGKET